MPILCTGILYSIDAKFVGGQFSGLRSLLGPQVHTVMGGSGRILHWEGLWKGLSIGTRFTLRIPDAKVLAQMRNKTRNGFGYCI